MRRRTPADSAPEIAAWEQVCALVSGAALSPTVEVLVKTGLLGRLLDTDTAAGVFELADRSGLHEGYTHVALNLLATQALAERSVPPAGTRAAAVRLTASGRRWAARAGVYAGAGERMSAARRMRASLLAGGEAIEGVLEPEAARSESDARVALHRAGPMVAAIVGALGRVGALRRLYQAPLGWLPLEGIGVPASALAPALGLLEALGWFARDGDLVALTPQGRGAARWAPLFNYVYGYFSVYERATALLSGESGEPPDTARDESDRELLLTGKAYVFRTGLRQPLEAVLTPLLADAAGRPRVVLDMNAGDGTVLCAVDEIARGAGAGSAVRLVGLVRNSVAEARCRSRLEAAGVSCVLLRADFSDPKEVVRALGAAGLDLRDALVVSKTTIHDRRFIGARGLDLGPRRGAASQAVFVSPEGDWIEPTEMEDDLAAFFARWRRHLGVHGLIAIDTHAVAPEIAARTWEQNAVTHVAASHGYSSQYLIECDRFREAARRGGFSTRFQRDLGTDRVEAVTMSLDHFVP